MLPKGAVLRLLEKLWRTMLRSLDEFWRTFGSYFVWFCGHGGNGTKTNGGTCENGHHVKRKEVLQATQVLLPDSPCNAPCNAFHESTGDLGASPLGTITPSLMVFTHVGLDNGGGDIASGIIILYYESCETLNDGSQGCLSASRQSMLVPSAARAFYGLHWTDYDLLWYQACGRKFETFAMEGLEVLKDFVCSRIRGEDTWERVLDELRQNFPKPSRLYEAVVINAHSKTAWEDYEAVCSLTSPHRMFDIHMAWLGAARRAKNLPVERIVQEEQRHASMGGLVIPRPSLHEMCQQILCISKCKCSDVPIHRYARTLVCDGSPVLRKSLQMPVASHGEMLGLVSAAQYRGFSCTDKICEYCRVALPSSAQKKQKQGSCSGCRLAYYCNTEHQRLNWKNHSEVCSKKYSNIDSKAHKTSGSRSSTKRAPVFRSGDGTVIPSPFFQRGRSTPAFIFDESDEEKS